MSSRTKNKQVIEQLFPVAVANNYIAQAHSNFIIKEKKVNRPNALIKMLLHSNNIMHVREIAEKTGLSQSTCYRSLQQLTESREVEEICLKKAVKENPDISGYRKGPFFRLVSDVLTSDIYEVAPSFFKDTTYNATTLKSVFQTALKGKCTLKELHKESEKLDLKLSESFLEFMATLACFDNLGVADHLSGKSTSDLLFYVTERAPESIYRALCNLQQCGMVALSHKSIYDTSKLTAKGKGILIKLLSNTSKCAEKSVESKKEA